MADEKEKRTSDADKRVQSALKSAVEMNLARESALTKAAGSAKAWHSNGVLFSKSGDGILFSNGVIFSKTTDNPFPTAVMAAERPNTDRRQQAH